MTDPSFTESRKKFAFELGEGSFAFDKALLGHLVVTASAVQSEANVTEGKALESEGFMQFSGGGVEVGLASPKREVDAEEDPPLVCIGGNAPILLEACLGKGEPWHMTSLG